jgi:hypothetical protein
VWSKIWQSLGLALAVLVPLYVLLLIINSVWLVDFRAWVVSLMPMSPQRFQAFVGYLIPFAMFFGPQSVVFAGFLRAQNGRAGIGREMVTSAVVFTFGALIWILLAYIPLFAGQPIIFAPNPGAAAAAGLGAIYYLPLLVLWPLAACLPPGARGLDPLGARAPPTANAANAKARNARVFNRLVVFCIALPHLIPRHCATANTTMTVVAIVVALAASPGNSATENSPITMETAAAVPAVEIQSLHPTMKPGYSPSAYRENTYWPPERGIIAPSSASCIAPRSA